MTPEQIDAQWRSISLVDLYDFNQSSLSVRAAQLGELAPDDVIYAYDAIRETVVQQASALDDEMLCGLATSVADDLYRHGSSLTRWEGIDQTYVAAVCGTFFALLNQLGYTLNYLVENTFPDDLTRPLSLFPEMYQLAGIVYVCPHEVATRLPEGSTVPHTTEGLRPLVDESRHVSQLLVERAMQNGSNIAYLELDFDPGCLDEVLRMMSQQPGSIHVFRNAPPLPGTKVNVQITPRQ